MSRTVHITAASRLHFGLWALAGGPGRQFGGVGAMVERPGIRLVVRTASQFNAVGSLADRAEQFVRRWAEFHRRELPACQIEILSAAPEHAGLGTGTQLGLSIAAGLSALVGLPCQSPPELALSVGRGLRSAVGVWGFAQGGLIVERGKLPGEPISPLDCRIDLPEDWRFVLIRPHGLTGLSGDDEAQAIASLPAIPQEVTDRLIAEARDRLIPAAATGDFEVFAQSLYRYGRESGACFAARQGGAYNGPVLTQLVKRLRALGAAGIGQSSWGPTLFAVQPNQHDAERLADRLQTAAQNMPMDVLITAPADRGTQVVLQDGP